MGNQDSRVEDYLNDKFQAHADLENIDILLQNIRDQQQLLESQVRSDPNVHEHY